MAKILIRCGMMPFESISSLEMIKKDRTGSNIGNLIYQYAIVRTLMTEENELFADGYKIDESQVDFINNNYDAYVIPLADAFREDFRPFLRRYTSLFKKLKIPVYVIGVGLRAPYEPNLDGHFPFDKDVEAFVKAVLDKSNMLGLRGQITSDYLSKLGFREGIDHTVIGCPSMYSFGRKIKIRDLKLTHNSPIAINATTSISESNGKAIDFLQKISEEYSNYNFIPQHYSELFLGFIGGPSVKWSLENYPRDLNSKYYKEGKVKFFLNAPTWFEYMKSIDFSIGTRLHGNITATINGTPSITIAHDARMRELADYHNLPSIASKDVSQEIKLQELLEKIDLKSPEKVQSENFDHFIEFLDKNGINHIYKNNKNRKDSPLDKTMEKVSFAPAVQPITAIEDKEKFWRLSNGIDIQTEKIEKANKHSLDYQKRISKKLRNKIHVLEDENEKLKKKVGIQNEIKKKVKKYLSAIKK